MLTLTRKPGQEIIVGDEIRIIVKEVRGCQVRLGILAPASVIITRGEVALEVEPADPDSPAGPAKPAKPARPAKPKPLASAAPGPARPLPPPPGISGLPGAGAPRFTLENLFLPDSPVGRATAAAAARDRLSARPPRLSRASRRPPRLV